ncbi:MAG: C39 family peptidase [bacterium]|nr:C39 family peptidase [bacterium]
MNKKYLLLFLCTFFILFFLIILTTLIRNSSLHSSQNIQYKIISDQTNNITNTTNNVNKSNASSVKSDISPTIINIDLQAQGSRLTPTETVLNIKSLTPTSSLVQNQKNNIISPTSIIPTPTFSTPTNAIGGRDSDLPLPTSVGTIAFDNSGTENTQIKFQGVNMGPGDMQGSDDAQFRPQVTLNISQFPLISQSPHTSSNTYVYYSQCDGNYDNYALPNGCTMCESGCGPATVAMILSSLVSPINTPAHVADTYKQYEFALGCDGSKIVDAQSIIHMSGLKVTDLTYLASSTKNEVIQELKLYIKAGWTLFTLARFCDAGCGHFFWITDIDDNNVIWTYDPYYGKKQLQPLNTSIFDPFPKYRVAFGVKKN